MSFFQLVGEELKLEKNDHPENQRTPDLVNFPLTRRLSSSLLSHRYSLREG